MHNVGTWNTAWLICKASATKAELPEGARSIIFILLSYKCEFHTGTPQPGAQHTALAQRLGGVSSLGISKPTWMWGWARGKQVDPEVPSQLHQAGILGLFFGLAAFPAVCQGNWLSWG